MTRAAAACLVLALSALAAQAAAPPTAVAPPTDVPPSATHAIQQLVRRVELEAPETIKTLALWQWEDDKLAEPYRRAFRDDLEIELIQSPRFAYFNRDRFRKILAEHNLTVATLADPKAMAVTGIDSFLSVEVLDSTSGHAAVDLDDSHTVLLAKLTDAKTAAIAWAAHVEGANPAGVKRHLGRTPPKNGTTRCRQIATGIAGSLKANPERLAAIKTVTLSFPGKDGTAGIGIQNPLNADFDVAAFKRELLVAVSGTQTVAYVDPDQIAHLLAQWLRDGDAVAEKNKQALAGAFAIDGYLFGEIRKAAGKSVQLSMRLVSLKDGSEAWAAKVSGADTHLYVEPREIPQPPVPREEPPEPAELTLAEIERPLKEDPIPQPDLVPLPSSPSPTKRFSPVGTVLYPAIGLPADLVDTTFLVADRIPLLGAATSAVYRYGGLGWICRAGTHRRHLRDLTSGRILTYGQLTSRDRLPDPFPLVNSARAHPSTSVANYILQITLYAATAGDLVDAAYTTIDRTPVLGTVTTPLLLPLDYAWRAVPDDRDIYVPQVTPLHSRDRLTYGSLASAHPISLFPNARTWPFIAPSRRARREALQRYLDDDARARKENDRRMDEWRTAEGAA